MKASDDDRGLRRMFEQLRDEDRRATPEFEKASRRTAPATPRAGLRLAWAGGAAAVAALALILALRPVGTVRDVSTVEALAMARELSSWTAPSDGIYDVSGLTVLSGVPSLELTSLALPELATPASTGDSPSNR